MFSLWMIAGGFIGVVIGQRKGINLAMAFLGGVLLGPLSILMLFVSNTGKNCPKCAEKIKQEALVC